MEVKRISASDTRQIRSQILRPGKPLSECVFPGDDDELTFHLGAFVDGKVVSVASFYYESHPELKFEHQFRLRGMATLPEHQKHGLSSALLKTAIPLIKMNHCHLLWCNARVVAKGFYEKVGFQAHGETFDIADIGPHIVMFYEIR